MASTTYPQNLTSRPNYTSSVALYRKVGYSPSDNFYLNTGTYSINSNQTIALDSYINGGTYGSIIASGTTSIKIDSLSTIDVFPNFFQSAWTTSSSVSHPQSSVSGAYGNGIYAASVWMTSDAVDALRVSTNGVTWKTQNVPNYYAGTYQRPYITFGNGIFCVLNSSNSSVPVAYSTDTVTWTTGISFSGATSPSAFKYLKDKFIFANNYSSVSYSTDAISWTSNTMAMIGYTQINPKGIAYGNNTFVAVGSSQVGGASAQTISASSTDGITWTQRTIVGGFWSDVAFGNGVFVAVSSPGTASSGSQNSPTTLAASSTDGITWTQRTMPSAQAWLNISFGSGVFFATPGVVTATQTAYSTDGITWTQISWPGYYPNVIFYGNKKFVVLDGGPSTSYYTISSQVPFYLPSLSIYSTTGDLY